MGWIICLKIAVKESLGFMYQPSRVKIGSATRQKDEGRCVCHFIEVLTKNTFCESLWGIEPQTFGSTLRSTLQRQRFRQNSFSFGIFLTVWGFQLKFLLFLRQLSCAFFFYMLEFHVPSSRTSKLLWCEKHPSTSCSVTSSKAFFIRTERNYGIFIEIT